MQKEEIKRQLGEYAVRFVEDGMVVGLGTGSTAEAFIHALAKSRKKVVATATSYASEALAFQLGIPCVSLDSIASVDITFDGADEIDPQNRLIKGAGGALLREKIMAASSRRLVIMADESKLVEKLGRGKIPLDIIPFGHLFTIRQLNRLGFHGSLRMQGGAPFLTDNKNYIYDIQLSEPTSDPIALAALLEAQIGVVDSGFFFNLATDVLVGMNNGTISERTARTT